MKKHNYYLVEVFSGKNKKRRTRVILANSVDSYSFWVIPLLSSALESGWTASFSMMDDEQRDFIQHSRSKSEARRAQGMVRCAIRKTQGLVWIQYKSKYNNL